MELKIKINKEFIILNKEYFIESLKIAIKTK